MRILCITPFYRPSYIYGGPTRSIPALCEGLVDLGCNVSVYSTNANGSGNLQVQPGKIYDNDGVSTSYFSRNLTYPGYFFSRDLARACHDNAHLYDLLYINANWVYPLIPGCRAALNAGVPYVIAPRTAFMRKTWNFGFPKKAIYHLTTERRLVNKAAAVHYTTDLEYVESSWLHLRPEAIVIPNTVDFREFENLPPRGQFRQKHQIASETKFVLYLGRIEPRKGLELTIQSFADTIKNGDEAVLVLAGPEKRDYAQDLGHLCATLGITNRVHFIGYLDSTERLKALRDADIFILTSHAENFGMALVEAMALQLAPIISDQVGISSDIAAASAGIVVPLNARKISQSLSELLNNDDLRRSYGQKAAKFARDIYRAEKVAGAMLREFERLV
jgi:glycosyltransferase involved in cell wall biosynthesis